jgi:hypothetical protein
MRRPAAADTLSTGIGARPKDAFVARARQRSSSSKRAGDLRLIVFSVFLVLAAGGLILTGILVSIRGGHSPTCARLSLGAVDSIRDELQGGPEFRTGGGACNFYLALDGGDVVAYKITLPGRDCTVRWHDDAYWCGSEQLTPDQLAQYPTTIETVGGFDTLVVDLRSPAQKAADATSSTT